MSQSLGWVSFQQLKKRRNLRYVRTALQAWAYPSDETLGSRSDEIRELELLFQNFHVHFIHILIKEWWLPLVNLFALERGLNYTYQASEHLVAGVK